MERRGALWSRAGHARGIERGRGARHHALRLAAGGARRPAWPPRRRALRLSRRREHPHRVLELRHGGRLPGGSRQRGSDRVPLGRGAQGQRHELLRRHHALRARQDQDPRRPGRVSHGDRIPRAPGDQPLQEPHHALRAPSGLLPGRRGDQQGTLTGDQQRSAHLARPVARQGERSRRSGLARQLGRLLRQTAGRRPGELLGHGRRLLRRVGIFPGRARLDAPRAGLEGRGARLPVGESPGRQRHLLALRHLQRGHHRLQRQHHLRALHGLRRGRLGALLRRHLRVRRRQRVLRQVLGVEPGLHLGPLRSRARPERELRAHRLPGLRLPRDPGQPLRWDRQRQRRHHGRAPRRWAGDAPGRPGRDSRLREQSLRHGEVHRRLRAARGPAAVSDRQLVDRRRGHGLESRVRRRRRRRGAGDPRHRRGRRHSDRRGAQLRPHRLERVGSDRTHRVQDEPHQGRRRQSRSDHRRDPLLYRCPELALAPLPEVLRPVRAGAVRLGARRQLQHRVPVRFRPVHPQGRPARALQPGARLRSRPERAAQHGRDRPADLQRQLPIRGATPDAHAHRRGGRRLGAAVVGRRGGARRGPGLERLRLRGLQDLSLDRSRVPGSGGDHHRPRRRHRAPQAVDSVRQDRRPAWLFEEGRRGYAVLARRRDRHHAHVDRFLGDQRAGVLLRGRGLRLRRRLSVRLASDLPVTECRGRDTHRARWPDPAQERGGGAAQPARPGLRRRLRRHGGSRSREGDGPGLGAGRELEPGA